MRGNLIWQRQRVVFVWWPMNDCKIVHGGLCRAIIGRRHAKLDQVNYGNSVIILFIDLWTVKNYKSYNNKTVTTTKSRKSDTLGPVELIVWLEQGNQGDRREQDDQGEVSIIIFGLSKSSGFQKYSICWVFQALCLCLCLCRCLCHCLCLCICVLLWFLNSFHHKLSEYVWL